MFPINIPSGLKLWGYKSLYHLAVGDDTDSSRVVLDGDNCWRNAINLDESAAKFHENDTHVENIEFFQRIKAIHNDLFRDKRNVEAS